MTDGDVSSASSRRPGRTRLLSEIAGRLMRLPAPASRDITVVRDLPVPMDDDAILLANRYVPAGTGGAMPTVLVRSPYGRNEAVGFIFGRLLAERGLQSVVQSVRGTFGSGGELDPFNERADGLATLRWLRAQPWHEGPVGMIGPSYMGIVQWAIADCVDAVSASVTASQFHGMTYGSGSVSLANAMSWMFMLEVQERRLAPLLVALGLRRKLPRLYDEVPLRAVEDWDLGDRFPVADWLAEMAPDSPYWSARDYSSSVGRVTAPVQLHAGWFDIFLPWQIEDYRALREGGRHPQLVVGPWTHLSPGLAGLSLRDGIGWLRANLLGDDRMVSTVPVRVYLNGANRWLELEGWPPPDVVDWDLHLRPEGELGEEPPSRAAEPSRYRYDPAMPTPSIGGPLLLEREPVRDNAALEAREDVLVFTGPPLLEDVDVAGPVFADIHFRSSRGHADVFVRICEVDPAGVSLNVSDALIRLSPDAPARDADGVARVRFDLWPTAHRFARGNRIRVQVSSGAHPRYIRNPGTGEDPLRATRLVASDQEVFHDPDRPSSVRLKRLPR
jgi:uncharacterized protein